MTSPHPTFRKFAMLSNERFALLAFAFVVLAAASCTTTCHAGMEPESPNSTALTFELTYDPAITESFTGRVYLMVGKGTSGREPRFGPSWMGPDPFYGLNVTDWKAGEPLSIAASDVDSFPVPFDELPTGDYRVQAVLRCNLDSASIGTGAGTAFSDAMMIHIDAESQGKSVHQLEIVHTAPERQFVESNRIKLMEVKSELLTAFHGRDIMLRAGVILPKNYTTHPDKEFPVLYWIGGFGSNHMRAMGMERMFDNMNVGDDLAIVILDPSCYFGHHVFADSAANGPRGQSLIKEIIPQLEKQFRFTAHSDARFLSGASSGGWSSLWLQVNYPDTFGGTWSIVPDPVDFHDFQRIDLYNDNSNMYVDADGNKRPLMRQTRSRQERVMIWYEDFAKMEVPYGDGGQLRSFEAAFSPLSDTGEPLPLYDRDTGAIDTNVANAWKPFDICLKLKSQWPELGPQLQGKLNVFAGEFDNFYLEGAVRRLKTTMQDLGSDAVIEIVPDRDHGSTMDAELMQRIEREALQIYEDRDPNRQ